MIEDRLRAVLDDGLSSREFINLIAPIAEPLADVVAAARELKVRGYRSDRDGSAVLVIEDSFDALRAALARLDEKEPQE